MKSESSQKKLFCNSLKDITNVVLSGYSFRGKVAPNSQGNVALVRMVDFADDGILNTSQLQRTYLEGFNEELLLRPGDLLFKARGVTFQSVLVDQELPNAIPVFPLILVRPIQSMILSTYLSWYLNHPKTQYYFERFAEGSVNQNLNRKAIEDLPLLVPPLKRQHQIVELAQLRSQECQILRELADRKQDYTNRILMEYVQQS